MENFLAILKKYQSTVRFYMMMVFKITLFFYLLYCFENGIENIIEMISVFVSAGFLITPIKSR